MPSPLTPKVSLFFLFWVGLVFAWFFPALRDEVSRGSSWREWLTGRNEMPFDAKVGGFSFGLLVLIIFILVPLEIFLRHYFQCQDPGVIDTIRVRFLNFIGVPRVTPVGVPISTIANAELVFGAIAVYSYLALLLAAEVLSYMYNLWEPNTFTLLRTTIRTIAATAPGTIFVWKDRHFSQSCRDGPLETAFKFLARTLPGGLLVWALS